MADIELVVRLDQETLQDLYDSRYVSPHIKEVFRSAKSLPKGHGDLIDVNDLDITEIITDDYSGNQELEVVLKEDIDSVLPIIKAEADTEIDKEIGEDR